MKLTTWKNLIKGQMFLNSSTFKLNLSVIWREIICRTKRHFCLQSEENQMQQEIVKLYNTFWMENVFFPKLVL